MQLEIEQKFPVADPTALRERIAKLAAERLPPVEQNDTYYNHPARDFRTTDEALRIRRTSDGAVVTYKGPRLDSDVKTRQEIELPLAEPESWPALLLALGFLEVATVSKHRLRFRLRREPFDVEIVIDQVEGVGSFAEVEVVADESQIDEAQQVVQALALELGLEQPERRSYLSMLLQNAGEAAR